MPSDTDLMFQFWLPKGKRRTAKLVAERDHSGPGTGLNATHKTPMYEMPLIYVFGVGARIFCIGVLGNGILSLAFCPEIEKNLMPLF